MDHSGDALVITARDIEFAAGFILGEGHFSTYTHGTARVDVNQVEVWPLEKLRRTFGGAIYPALRPGHKTQNHWIVQGPLAAGLMMTLYALMSPKRKNEITNALARWRSRLPAPQHRHQCPQGHSYTESNTYAYTLKNGHRRRYCKACAHSRRNDGMRRYRARRRLAHALLVAV